MTKRMCVSLTACLCIVIMLLSSSRLHALELMAGVKVWYVFWQPSIKDAGRELAPWEGWQYIDGGSGMMYGPSISVGFSDRVSFSVSYLYGGLYADYNADFKARQSPTNYNEQHFSGSVKTIRHDVDAALSYRVGESFKVFAGFKYQPVITRLNKQGGMWQLLADGSRDPAGTHLYLDKSEMTFRQYGYAPALGAGYSLPISDRYSLNINASFIYFFGSFEASRHTDDNIYYLEGDLLTPNTTPGFKSTADLSGFGVNAEPSLLILISDNIILNIGFRFQYVRSSLEGGKDFDNADGLNDYVYGGYLSALYRL